MTSWQNTLTGGRNKSFNNVMMHRPQLALKWHRTFLWRISAMMCRRKFLRRMTCWRNNGFNEVMMHRSRLSVDNNTNFLEFFFKGADQNFCTALFLPCDVSHDVIMWQKKNQVPMKSLASNWPPTILWFKNGGSHFKHLFVLIKQKIVLRNRQWVISCKKRWNTSI